MPENPRTRSPRFLEFKEQVRRQIDLAGTNGLEIGAFDRPVFTKNEAAVAFLDYRSTDEIRAYAAQAPGHNADFVEPIDYVVGAANDWSQVPDTYFDWIISCHALEHCPNLITMLRTIGQKLRPGGVLVSNLPDKRATFDVFRPLSTLGQIVEDFVLERRSPTFQAVFDQHYYAANISEADAWTHTDDAVVRHNQNFARALSEARISQTRYYDAHRYVFTSESFQAIMAELCEQRMIPFAMRAHTPTKVGEMSFVNYLTRVQ